MEYFESMFKEENLDWLLAMGLKAAAALAIIIVGFTLSKWAESALSRAFGRTTLDKTLCKFFSKLAKWAVVVLTVVITLGYFGVQTATFAAVLASLSFAIGLAWQGSLSNFAAGVMLLILRPFKVGDYIKAGGTEGIVAHIDLFSIALDTGDNRRLSVPNGAIFGNTIENVSHHEMRRCDVKVGVDYSADIDETRAVLESVVASQALVSSEKPHAIVLSDLGASSVDWTLRMWCKKADYWALRESALRALKYALDEANIGIPFPQMDVHLIQEIEKKAALNKEDEAPLHS